MTMDNSQSNNHTNSAPPSGSGNSSDFVSPALFFLCHSIAPSVANFFPFFFFSFPFNRFANYTSKSRSFHYRIGFIVIDDPMGS